MTSADLPDVLAVQALNYPGPLRDSADAFASRLVHAPDWNLVARTDGRLDAYLVSHPWASLSPPAPDTVITAARGPVWYIHDLSVAPHARGRGLARALLEACRLAHPDVGRSELIAVEGASGFWSALGWTPETALEPELAAKVGTYGPQAVYMSRNLHPD